MMRKLLILVVLALIVLAGSFVHTEELQEEVVGPSIDRRVQKQVFRRNQRNHCRYRRL